jgi:hypothetical protein
MDIVTPTLIAALSMLSESVIKDAYDKLKKALISKPDDPEDLLKAIELLEERPESEGRREVLREEIQTSKVYLDVEVIQAARTQLCKLFQFSTYDVRRPPSPVQNAIDT